MHDIEHDRNSAELDVLTDAQLFDRAARTISQPKREAANSFVLHAPLELMARRLLLPQVPAHYRRAARERMTWLAAKYEQAGDSVDPARPLRFTSGADARHALVAAIREGDLERVDATATLLLEQGTRDEIMQLAGPTVALLGAAGHAPIGLYLAGRLATTSRSSLTLLRPIMRELAREPELVMQWTHDAHTPAGTEDRFMHALAGTPQLGLPGNDFIFPVVHQVDASGLARGLINDTMPADLTLAAAVTMRIAARSMLQDDPQFAPYGWTHCLTLPHAIFELTARFADAPHAAAVAATYVVGFRAAESRSVIDPNWTPEPTAINLLDALEAEPSVAASAWFHAPEPDREQALPELIGRAAVHEDAHVVKYTLACLAAAGRDPQARSLYVAAAAYLAAWWAAQPGTAFRDDL